MSEHVVSCCEEATSLPSVAAAPNERWSTDLCRIWSGEDGQAVLALVMDCHSRELLGWHLSHSGNRRPQKPLLSKH